MTKTQAPRPNILLILADDMGYSDIGCFGGEISTPNIDSLAQRGIRFTHFYNNAVCMPTRASLMTGLYPHQVGAADAANLTSDNNVTVAEVLRTAGYRTLMSGKWHNGNTPGKHPYTRGFDRFWGLLSGCSNYFNPGLPRPNEPEPVHKSPGDMRPWGDDGEIMHPYTPEDPDFYATDVFTDHAVEFLDQYGGDEQPFFLYLPYTAPHFPMQARPEDIARYRGKFMKGWDRLREERYERLVASGIIDNKWKLSDPDPLAPRWEDVADKDAWDLKMAVYAAMIDRMDQGIGRVLGKIRQLGKEDDTLVFFLSDNGGCGQHINRTPDLAPGPVNTYCTVDAPWANLSNTPFRKFKVFDHEGGISTPMIACWPNGIAPGGMCHELGHVIDFMPTLAELAGAECPTEYGGHKVLPAEGRSFASALSGGSLGSRDPLFWEFQQCRAVRLGNWKLVSQGPPRNHIGVEVPSGLNSWELYDMSIDRSETNDLSAQHPDKVKELDDLWREWYDRCKADESTSLPVAD
jgi:arylsulfatase A-like enzyme